MIRSVVRLASVALALASIAACGGGDDDDPEVTLTLTSTSTSSPAPANPPGNLLRNPGFEAGRDPWITLVPETGFEVTQDVAFSGVSSALLAMNEPPGSAGTKVYYLVQEMNPDQFPDVVRGRYRVDNWQKGTPKQYLQMVVIAIGSGNSPVAAENYQLRYVLTGITEAPFVINNAKFLFSTADEPVDGQWYDFEANIRADFQQLWGAIPEGYDTLRFLFEVRYDDRSPQDGASVANVYYDDLYVGSTDPAAPAQ